jgi:hypothetical protein
MQKGCELSSNSGLSEGGKQIALPCQWNEVPETKK